MSQCRSPGSTTGSAVARIPAERLLDRARRHVAHARGDTNHRTQRDTPKRASPDQVWRVPTRMRSRRMTHVRQDHLKCFIRSTYSRSSISCSAEKLVTVDPRHRAAGGLADGRQHTFLLRSFLAVSATTSRSPSSIRDVRVRPSAAALRLATLEQSSGRRTVVRSLICQDISRASSSYVITAPLKAERARRCPCVHEAAVLHCAKMRVEGRP